MSIYRLFGNRLIVKLLTALPAHESRGGHMPPLPAGVMMAVPADQSGWSSPFGKGRVEVVGEAVQEPDALDMSVIGSEEDSEHAKPPEGMKRFAQEWMEACKPMFANVPGLQTMPPVSVGDIVIFRFYDASLLPDDESKFVVEGSGVVAVVREEEFAQ